MHKSYLSLNVKRKLVDTTTAAMLMLLVLILSVTCTESARILGVLPTAGHSHGLWNRVLIEELASRGHQVVALTPDPGQDTSNLRYVNVENSYVAYKESFTWLDMAGFSAKETIDLIYDWYLHMCKQQIRTQGTKEIMNIKEKIDLVIFDAVGNECFLGLLAYLSVPVVAVSPYGCTWWGCTLMGASEPMAVYPDSSLPYTTQMTFWQRLENVVIVWYSHLVRTYYYLPQHEKVARQVFGDHIPPLADIERNSFSLMLINSGPAGVDPSKAFPPSIVEVGCLQCHPGKPLSAELQEYLDSATEGAIFFSLGSNVRSDSMNPHILQIFLDVFSQLPQRVLWKWESDSLPGQPSNVKLGKWLPQQDILAHPNLRLFITHGGRLSSHEAAYHGVPILCLPVLMDQFKNGEQSQKQGMGINLPFAHVTLDKLSKSIRKLLDDPSYRQVARKKRDLFRDQLETPLNRAVFWTEYVLRHGNSSHLRSPVTLVPWFQLYLLDVAAFIVTLFVLLVLMLKTVVRLVCRNIRQNTSKLNEKKRL